MRGAGGLADRAEDADGVRHVRPRHAGRPDEPFAELEHLCRVNAVALGGGLEFLEGLALICRQAKRVEDLARVLGLVLVKGERDVAQLADRERLALAVALDLEMPQKSVNGTISSYSILM